MHPHTMGIDLDILNNTRQLEYTVLDIPNNTGQSEYMIACELWIQIQSIQDKPLISADPCFLNSISFLLFFHDFLAGLAAFGKKVWAFFLHQSLPISILLLPLCSGCWFHLLHMGQDMPHKSRGNARIKIADHQSGAQRG